MRAILIDPVAETVTEIDYTEGHNSSCEEIYKALSTDEHRVDTVDLLRLPTANEGCVPDGIFFDDNGCDVADTGHFYEIGGVKLVGRGLVLGSDRRGNSAPPAVSVETIRANVRFLGQLPESERPTYGFTFASSGGDALAVKGE